MGRQGQAVHRAPGPHPPSLARSRAHRQLVGIAAQLDRLLHEKGVKAAQSAQKVFVALGLGARARGRSERRRRRVGSARPRGAGHRFAGTSTSTPWQGCCPRRARVALPTLRPRGPTRFSSHLARDAGHRRAQHQGRKKQACRTHGDAFSTLLAWRWAAAEEALRLRAQPPLACRATELRAQM